MAVVEAIQTQYLEADATSVTFTDIPATYEHLQLRMSAKPDWDNMNTHGGNAAYGALRMNGVTGTNYASVRMEAYDTTDQGAAGGNQSELYCPRFATVGEPTSGFSSRPAFYGGAVLDILDYVNTDKMTTVMCVSGTSGPINVSLDGGVFNNNLTVHTILIDQSGGSNWVRGSVFTLYGWNSS